MSYVLGWKTQSNVYIAADSMITSAPISIEHLSSFGERHICDGRVSVAERALKIVVESDLAVGLCGDFAQARSLASCLFRAYRQSRSLETALREMIVAHGPYPMKHPAQLVVAWRGPPIPRLFSFNQDGDGAVREFHDGEGVPLGSVSGMQKGMTQVLLKKLFELERQGSAPYLAATLGVLQSFGVHDYLLQDAVGGAFTGLCVSSDAVHWQPDLLYVVDEPGNDIWSAVATCVRDSCLIVNSTMTNQARIFGTDVMNELDISRWNSRWGSFAHSYLTSRRFDFVVVLGLKHHVVIVVEMNREIESRVFKFHDNAPVNDGVHWFELLASVINHLRRPFLNSEPDARDFRFGFEPYEPPLH